jgi:ABC-2 type transport system ATP-binding protein
MDPVLKLSHVSKNFIIPSERHTSLKSKTLAVGRKPENKMFKVLKDISFSIRPGEFLAIVGKNGSGKSTLLKTIAGIYVPNDGYIEVNGRISPFLELGVGFNPELTARENVYLNGAILGLEKKEIDGLFDEIISFAELERFVDQKLKNFSSGMQVRLAFSVAIRAHAPILLMDEVLAVGDANFQKKCFSVFESMKQEGRTLIFVSHDLSSIRRFCDRVIVLKNGRIDFDGPTEEGLERYESNMKLDTEDRLKYEMERKNSHPKHFQYIEVLSKSMRQGKNKSLVFKQDAGELELEVTLRAKKDLENVNVGFEVRSLTDYTLFFLNTKKAGQKIKFKEGEVKTFVFKFSNFMAEGNYEIYFAAADLKTNDFYFSQEHFLRFIIEKSEYSGGLFSPEFELTIKDREG